VPVTESKTFMEFHRAF